MLHQDHIIHKQAIIINRQICFNNKPNNKDRMDETLITTEVIPINETRTPMDTEIKTHFREVIRGMLEAIIIINVDLVGTKITHRI